MKTQIEMPLNFKPHAKNRPELSGDTAEIRCDGGCWPNPGPMYGSFNVIFNGTEILRRNRVEFGHGTSNVAEFRALQMALEETLDWCLKHRKTPALWRMLVLTDSMILRNRLIGKRANKIFKKSGEDASQRMISAAKPCLEMLIEFGSFKVEWQSRERNVENFGH